MAGRFYNTTELDGEMLQQAWATCETIADFVLKMFETYECLSPYQCHKLARESGFSWTINGIRASITTLTKEGFLTKTSVKIDGPYNRPEYLWKRRADGQQAELF